MLVVMEDRNLHGALEFLFNLEALGGLDVFEIDSAEGGLEQLAGSDHFLGIFAGQLDVEDVDIGEALEQHRLAFHDRLACQRADVAEAEDRGAVRYDAHQVALGGVLVSQAGIALDLFAGDSDPWCVRQAEVPLRPAGLGRRDGALAGGRPGMVFQCVLLSGAHERIFLPQTGYYQWWMVDGGWLMA